MKFRFPTNNKPSTTMLKIDTRALSFAAIAVIGLCFTSTAFAETPATSTALQVASVEPVKQEKHASKNMENFELSEDTDTANEHEIENDNRIGAFSMKDGAMMGVYGDGEYAE